ncbi:MAG: DMT family transporter [Chitinophagaceae bacterium]|nr:DMT family transporter [Chitinophagaceae bacterium]
MKKNLRAHLALIGANLIFGASYSIVKIITPGYMPAFALNAARVIVAIFFFTISFGFSGGRAWPAKKDWPLLALCSLTGIVINQLFFIKGVSMTSPIHSSLLSLATPLFITGIAAWLLRESFTILKAIGLLLGLSGAGMLILLKGSGNHSPDSLTGDILVLFNAISYSFYLVLIKPLMSQYQGTDILRWLFLLGAIIILPLGPPDLLSIQFQSWPANAWAALLFVTIGATFLAYLFNIYGISQLGAAATGSYIYTQPIFATLIACFFFGEELTLQRILAALLIIGGVFLTNYKKRPPSLG